MSEGQAPRSGFGGDAEIQQLDFSGRAEHDIFRFQIAMDHASLVEVIENFAHGNCNLHRAARIDAIRFVQYPAERRSFNPLHRHIHPAALFRLDRAHNAWMIHLPADVLLSLETVKIHHVALVLRMRNLQRDRQPCMKISGPENRRHSALRNQLFDPKLIHEIARLQIWHQFWTSVNSRGLENPKKFVRYCLAPRKGAEVQSPGSLSGPR